MAGFTETAQKVMLTDSRMDICTSLTMQLRMHTHGLPVDICLSVCLSVKRVYCDKTKAPVSYTHLTLPTIYSV